MQRTCISLSTGARSSSALAAVRWLNCWLAERRNSKDLLFHCVVLASRRKDGPLALNRHERAGVESIGGQTWALRRSSVLLHFATKPPAVVTSVTSVTTTFLEPIQTTFLHAHTYILVTVVTVVTMTMLQGKLLSPVSYLPSVASGDILGLNL